MPRFYFTYGTSGQPFNGGWTEIVAPDIHVACAVFRGFHPDKHEGLMNCAEVYTERAFEKSGMNSPEGNFGQHCHERITITKESIDGRRFIP